MPDWFAFLLATLATYRIARMLAVEEGPFGLFAAARARIDPEQKTWLGRGVNCPLCAGVWVALIVVLLLLPLATWQMFVLCWLAVAGAMTVLYVGLEGA